MAHSCKGCTDRKPYCHSKCESYLKFEAKQKEIRNKRLLEYKYTKNDQVEANKNRKLNKYGHGPVSYGGKK